MAERPLTHPSPPVGERVAPRRVRGTTAQFFQNRPNRGYDRRETGPTRQNFGYGTVRLKNCQALVAPDELVKSPAPLRSNASVQTGVQLVKGKARLVDMNTR